MNELRNRISELENKYYELFSVKATDGQIVRYSDDELKDMYDHNFTLISASSSKETIDEIIQGEKAKRKEAGYNFLKIKFDAQVAEEKIPADDLARLTDLEYYSLTRTVVHQLKEREDIEVIKLSDVLVDEARELDELCEPDESLDFTNRRFDRRLKVYLRDAPLYSYLAMQEWVVVGSCDYFAADGACMLEDFVVDPEVRNQGIGTTLLKSLANRAFVEHNDLVFLTTEAIGSAKEMYQKLGFEKILVKTEALYRF